MTRLNFPMQRYSNSDSSYSYSYYYYFTTSTDDVYHTSLPNPTLNCTRVTTLWGPRANGTSQLSHLHHVQLSSSTHRSLSVVVTSRPWSLSHCMESCICTAMRRQFNHFLAYLMAFALEGDNWIRKEAFWFIRAWLTFKVVLSSYRCHHGSNQDARDLLYSCLCHQHQNRCRPRKNKLQDRNQNSHVASSLYTIRQHR